MDFKILEEKDNKLLGRKELMLELKHPSASTPKKQDLIKELVAKYSVPEEHVVIDFIFTKKGLAESKAKVKIYKEKPKVKEKKVKEKKEEKSEAQASETK
jgi:small subunit ribosomal protein S24e